MGDEGWFQEANPPTYPYAPDVGINFVTNLGIQSLDFGTFHSYPEVREPLLFFVFILFLFLAKC